MAGMLYRAGDFDRALNASEIALKQQPTLRGALQGAAMAYRQKKDYSSAAARLRTILRDHPQDAEIWMNLGDVAVYQGDELLARECYTRAMEVDPDAARVIEDARKRLALMAEVSRTYR
jgi:cytochrome c-type biogenesis protein CcmH/NrfG